MTSIVASADSYELTKVPFFQKIGNMAISGVIYTVVAVVGVVIGVAGATYMFEQTEIEPKIKEVAQKIEEGVKNIPTKTVEQVAAAITDLSKTGKDVVNVVESLAEGGNVENGNIKGGNVDGDLELSNMSKKTDLPLSVNSLTAATTSEINKKAEENANAVIAEQTKAVEAAVATNVNEQTKAAQTLFTDKSKAGQSLLADKSKAVEESVKQTKTLQEAAGEQTKASAKLGSDAMQQYKLKKKTMSNISKPDFKLDYSQAASIAAGAAGGGKKTKSKRTKLTKVDSNVKKSVKRQRKPRTKKCLIEKDNKMYMSFCI